MLVVSIALSVITCAFIQKTKKFFPCSSCLVIYNLGTGKGTSVLEMIKAYEEATNIKIPYEIKPRRSGDVAINYADCSKANIELGFKAKYTIKDACLDGYNYQLAEGKRKNS